MKYLWDLPEWVTSNNCVQFPTEAPVEIIDHYYHYLSQEMDADLIAQQMVSLQSSLLNKDDIAFIMAAENQYQKSCYMLEKFRLMDLHSLTTLCRLLESIDHQKHLGTLLLNGKRCKSSFAIMYTFVHSSTII